MNLKDTYNRIAKDWALDHPGDTWWIEVTNKYVSLLPTGGSVLDVGCGPGQKSKYLVEHGLKVTGIDFSENMIELAKKETPKATFFVKDIKEPLDIDQVFDGIFAQAVLLHIPKKEIESIIKNIIHPLKPGGLFYLAVKETKQDSPEEEMVMENDYGYEYERFFSYYTVSEIQKYLLDLNMEIIEINTTKPYKNNWIQVIARKLI